MMLSDEELRTLTDGELYQLRTRVLGEDDRRRRLAVAPAQVVDIARTYAEDGGDPAVLTDAITNRPVVDQPVVDDPLPVPRTPDEPV